MYKIDLGNHVFDEEDLTSFRNDDYYPLVIGIETVFPERYRGKTKRSIEYTYGTFYKESGNANPMKYKYLAQKLLYNNTIFELNDIFGIENPNNQGNNNDMDFGDNNLCLVCMEAIKDTVVLPCRHLCLCRKCAQIVRM